MGLDEFYSFDLNLDMWRWVRSEREYAVGGWTVVDGERGWMDGWIGRECGWWC